jgi:hypothetical protein
MAVAEGDSCVLRRGSPRAGGPAAASAVSRIAHWPTDQKKHLQTCAKLFPCSALFRVRSTCWMHRKSPDRFPSMEPRRSVNSFFSASRHAISPHYNAIINSRRGHRLHSGAHLDDAPGDQRTKVESKGDGMETPSPLFALIPASHRVGATRRSLHTSAVGCNRLRPFASTSNGGWCLSSFISYQSYALCRQSPRLGNPIFQDGAPSSFLLRLV